jgi:hypothetical protein
MSNLENSSLLQRVPLSTGIFHQSYEQFLQEQKPDPLVLKQLQSLHIEWKDIDDDDDINDFPTDAKFQIDKHTNGTCGILAIVGEHTTVILKACCNWKVPIDNASSMCEMHFELYAQASLTPKALWKSHAQTPEDNIGKKEERLNDKIRSGVMNRMKEDPYVRRIMKEETALLCDASIQFKLHVPPPPPTCTVENKEDISTVYPTGVPPLPSSCIDELEERVYVSEDALEGLRRGLFSQMESSIFAMELLLAMPYLPQRSPCENLDERNEKKLEVMLSERVVMRVLEDVMVNECEKEGEDDLLSDLSISMKDESYEGEGLSEVQSSVGKRHKA